MSVQIKVKKIRPFFFFFVLMYKKTNFADVELLIVGCEEMGKYMLSPIVWLRRFRKRCGYGVHSPYAFDFITDVLYEHLPYYAYKDLDALHPFWVRKLRLRPLKLSRVLFRIANFVHPRRACVLTTSAADRAYMQAAVPSAQWTETLSPGSLFDFVCIDAPVQDVLSYVTESSVLVVSKLQENKSYWQQLLNDERVAISFDLYDLGVLMFDKRLNRKDYVVNF